ncbi:MULTISPECIES: thiamine phosphate synthase [unclassified Sedimentibacter]|uniref:thiamine phosphate synthase n=1 Tax=unclassified Sedimentibacter TaxID=2649220 RepID=UPI0027E08427|nr:thiamine phosphate synthase [Sedimentibacter sp. MB35-C1]WMJ76030.1 thiamine phosphate synthase [Sedimentibacter sp. MB35-C1]
MKFDTTLYFVTDSTGKTENEFLNVVEKACKGGVTLIQLREKNLTGRDYLKLALNVKIITDKYNIPLIIDDRIDVAMASDASGVHVGQNDIPVSYARKLMGKNKIIGATAKTVEQALVAYEQGADYLGVGAIYPTTTKVATRITDVSTLNDICRAVPIPVVAIGGLNINNIDILKESPIKGISVVSAVMKSIDPEKSAMDLKKKVADMLDK